MPADVAPIDRPQRAGHHHPPQRRQHERRAQDRADPDLVARLVSRHDRDDRQQRLGQGGSDRGEDRADGALRQAEPLADPLDAVREELRRNEDDQERSDQEDPIHVAGHARRGARVSQPTSHP